MRRLLATCLAAALALGCSKQAGDPDWSEHPDLVAANAEFDALVARAKSRTCERPSIARDPIAGHVNLADVFAKPAAAACLKEINAITTADDANTGTALAQLACGADLEQQVREAIRHTSACIQGNDINSVGPAMAMARLIEARASQLTNPDDALDLLLIGMQVSNDYGRLGPLVTTLTGVTARGRLIKAALTRLEGAVPATRLDEHRRAVDTLLANRPSFAEAFVGEPAHLTSVASAPRSPSDEALMRAISVELVRQVESACTNVAQTACAAALPSSDLTPEAYDATMARARKQASPKDYIRLSALGHALPHYAEKFADTDALLYTLRLALELRALDRCPSLEDLAAAPWAQWLNPPSRGRAAEVTRSDQTVTVTWPKLLGPGSGLAPFTLGCGPAVTPTP